CLQAKTVDRLGLDPMAVNDYVSGLLPAGFYYKTFLWPQKGWPFYERQIRRAAGLGQAPEQADPARYDKMNTHCDVLVIGAGPAGLAAALTAGRAGARVMLVDEQPEFGGSLLSAAEQIDDQPAADWLAGVVTELEAMSEVRLLPRATAFGHYDHNFVGVVEDCDDHTGGEGADGKLRQRLWRIRARRVVPATGALERPLVFANNDRPGVMLAAAVSAYIHRYGVLPGQRAVIFTNNDSAYRTALDLHAAGAEVAAIVDLRAVPHGDLHERVQAAGIQVLAGHVITAVHGRRRVQRVTVRQLSDGQPGGERIRLDCDLVASSGGWSPVVHLHCHTGAQPVWDDDTASLLPPASPNAC